MEALKKAEQAKQDAAAPTETALTLEAVEPAKEKGEPSFPELDLGAETSSRPAAPPPEPALAVEAAPPPPLPEAETGLAGMGGLPPNSQKNAAPTPKAELALEPATPPLADKPPIPPKPMAAESSTQPQNPARPAETPPRPASPPPKRPDAAKLQARNVFAAKTGATKPFLGLSKPILAVVGGSIALLMAGVGYYFYRELNPPRVALQPGPPTVTPAMPAPPPTPVVAAVPETPPASAAPSVPATEASKTPTAEDTAETLPESGNIRIQRGTPAETLNPNLTRAYQAMQAGNLSEAKNAYRKVLQADPNNRDALLGLAAIQERAGDTESAARLYQRLLDLDPNDGAAQAALTGLGQGDPVRSESRLKSLLTQQPDSATLHFALANLYADQQRWAEAQQSYFLAFQKQPGNPDYLYNLAVSLDHLGQNKLAQEYYRRALAAANRPHNFSPEEVQGRIDALEQAAPRQ